MKRILFVITSNMNLGDLAYCQEWICELGRKDFRYSFVLDKTIRQFVSKEDSLFFFKPDIHVKISILTAVADFDPNIIIFASSSCWNIKGQKGAEWGNFDNEILSLTIPILSFEPFIGAKEFCMGHNTIIAVPEIPEKVFKLVDCPYPQDDTDHIKRYSISMRFEQLSCEQKQKILKRIKASHHKKTILFPISKSNFNDCRKYFYDYYSYIARLFQSVRRKDILFLIAAPERIQEFDVCENVFQIGHQPYEKYLQILKSVDLYLTDCGISTSFLYAISSSIPTILLCNSFTSPRDLDNYNEWEKFRLRRNLDDEQAKRFKKILNNCKDQFINNVDEMKSNSTVKKQANEDKKKLSVLHGNRKVRFSIENLFPYKVFPYGMVDLFNIQEKLYYGNGCYCQVEVFAQDTFSLKVEALLFDNEVRTSVMKHCAEFISLCKELPSPSDIVEEVLSLKI